MKQLVWIGILPQDYLKYIELNNTERKKIRRAAEETVHNILQGITVGSAPNVVSKQTVTPTPNKLEIKSIDEF